MTEAVKKAMAVQRGNAFALHNHIVLEEAENGRVVLSMKIHEESKNPLGIVHGGAFYTMADSAAGIAANLGERRYVTRSSTMHYLANCREGTVRAEAKIIHGGRSTCIVQADIRSETGKLLATGEFSFFSLER